MVKLLLGSQSLVFTLGFLGFHFTVVIVVVLHILPVSRLYTAWPFIKEKPPDCAGVWLDVTTSRRERPSECFAVINPSCVVCRLLSVLRMTESELPKTQVPITITYLYILQEAVPYH